MYSYMKLLLQLMAWMGLALYILEPKQLPKKKVPVFFHGLPTSKNTCFSVAVCFSPSMSSVFVCLFGCFCCFHFPDISQLQNFLHLFPSSS